MRPSRRGGALSVIAGIAFLLAIAGPALAIREGESRLPDVDRRDGSVKPTPAQTARVQQLGASVQWTRFGTPADLYKASGVLGSGFSTTSDVTAARQFLKANATLYKLSDAEVDRLEVLSDRRIGKGSFVLLRQRLGSLPAGNDGLITVAVLNGSVVYATSSNTGDTSTPTAATLSGPDAWLRAARDVGLSPGAITGLTTERGWTSFRVAGMAGRQYVRKLALPTFTHGNIEAFEAIVIGGGSDGPVAYDSFVDGRTGAVLVRHDRVDNLANNPRWQTFPASPRLDLQSPFPAAPAPTDQAFFDMVDADTRQTWCWLSLTGCQRTLFNESPDAGFPAGTVHLREWDRVFDPAGNSAPSFATTGNNADTEQTWTKADVFPTGGDGIRATSATRDYFYPFANTWNNARCNPAALAPPGDGNDIQAAMANLFAQHNRMHDWSYHLGFREETFNLQSHNFSRTPPAAQNDPEKSGAQTGAVVGLQRNNANQRTLPDGLPGFTNMYLWQPGAASFYAPCADGAFDMSVIGHEYAHAISNRMVAGPDGGLDTREGGSMGESWSDLTAVEYLQEYGLSPVSGENAFAVAPYVTSNRRSGIRNYGMNDNLELHYGDIGYDTSGPQVHADGEIWSAVNYDIRQALVAKYNGAFPSSDRSLQARCANGRQAVDSCPGNRRWMQIVFDAFLFMQSSVNMVSARNAYLTADRLHFAGANQSQLWTAFARRGFGERAESFPNQDDDSEPTAQADPIGSYESPLVSNEATVRFLPTTPDGAPAPANAELFVGGYEARATPIMDTKPGDRPDTARFVPGTYEFVARAPGFGHVRFKRTFSAGQTLNLTVSMPRNLASSSSGATASGSGVDQEFLVDDTEETNWASLNAPFNENANPENPANNPQVTVDLAGSAAQTVRRARVSALLRPADAARFPQDPGGQNRFTALRSFQILTCAKTAAVDCTQDSHFTLRFTSAADAFPGVRPRPTAPALYIRSFNIPDVSATHVRLRVLESQCTGSAGYHGEQDEDPVATTDCRTSDAADDVRAAELQVLKTEAPF